MRRLQSFRWQGMNTGCDPFGVGSNSDGSFNMLRPLRGRMRPWLAKATGCDLIGVECRDEHPHATCCDPIRSNAAITRLRLPAETGSANMGNTGCDPVGVEYPSARPLAICCDPFKVEYTHAVRMLHARPLRGRKHACGPHATGCDPSRVECPGARPLATCCDTVGVKSRHRHHGHRYS